MVQASDVSSTIQLKKASIITIGDELLIGQTIDTNSAWMAQELNKAGIWVQRRVAVGDNAVAIRQALDEEGRNASIILITGGLGPTGDDITKPTLCEYFGGKLIVDEKVLAHVRHLFENVYRRPGPIVERNLKQAEVPDVCTVIHNKRGTAPGMWFEKDEKVYVSMPGVPHEMQGIMEDVIVKLKESFILPAIVHKTMLTAGQGESFIAELLNDFESSLPSHIRLAYLPSYGMVKLRLTGTGTDPSGVESEVSKQFEKLAHLVADYLVTNEDIPIELAIGKLLAARNKSVATAESCTGGYIAHLFTQHPGSSKHFVGSVVCYSNELKEDLLGVKKQTLLEKGAVSEETVLEMVVGLLANTPADYGIATSGIMGPDGGTENKPVGTVWIAVGNKKQIRTKLLHLRFERKRNIELTAHTVLNMLRIFIETEDA